MIVANFINGAVVSAEETSPLVDPATGTKFGSAAVSRAAEVDAAVHAAEAAFPAWSRTTPGERQHALLKLADLLEANADASPTPRSGRPARSVPSCWTRRSPSARTSSASSRAPHERWAPRRGRVPGGPHLVSVAVRPSA